MKRKATSYVSVDGSETVVGKNESIIIVVIFYAYLIDYTKFSLTLTVIYDITSEVYRLYTIYNILGGIEQDLDYNTDSTWFLIMRESDENNKSEQKQQTTHELSTFYQPF